MRKILRLITQILFGSLAVLLALIAFAVAFFGIAEAVADNSARTLPGYEREDLAQTLAKEVWSEEDYDFLYHQTGLGKPALDALRAEDGGKMIPVFQNALFYEGKIVHEAAAFTTPHDMLEGYTAPIAPLEDGDVIVSSSCHTFGWRNGHAAIVTNGATGTILESVAPGFNSQISSTNWFSHAANFIVLRLKDRSKEERREIAVWASNHLRHIPYSILTGFFSSPKDQGDHPETTHCSHLVWQAFYHFGYDIDPDGGPVCTSRDIAQSEYFEVIQVFGFDPDLLW